MPWLEGGNRFYDLGGLYHGTLNSFSSGTGWGSTSQPGGYGQLSSGTGTASYTRAPSFPYSDNVSVFAWFNRLTTTGGVHSIGSHSTSTPNFDWYFFTDGSNKLNVEVTTSLGQAITGSTVLAQGTWYRVGFTRSSAGGGNWNYALWVNGVQDATASYSISPTSGVQDLTLFGLSSSSTTATNRQALSLNDVCTWNRVLSASEIWADYDQSSRGNPDTLNRWSTFPSLAPTGPTGQPFMQWLPRYG